MKALPILCVVLTSFLSSVNSQSVLSFRLDPGTTKDANIRSDQFSTNNGASVDFIANAFTAQGLFFIQRSLMEFDLSALPPNAIILNATLSLYCNTSSGHAQLQHGDNGCVLQKITQAWEEYTVTWLNKPATTTEHEVYLPVSVNQTQNYPDIDITQIIRDFVAFPETNRGIMMKLIAEDAYRTMVFGSSDHPDPDKRPLLTIEYDTCSEPAVYPDFSYDKTGLYTVAFHDNSLGATSWNWDFGDGQSSQEQNPVHTYANAGNFQVCLTAGNSCHSLTLCDSVIFCPNYQQPLVMRLNLDNCYDAMVRTDQPNTNYGNTIDYIANAFTAQGNFFIQRSLMNFDFSQIPPGAEILSADLSLFCNTISGHAQFQYGDNLTVLQRITEEWGEYSVTWNNQPATDIVHQVFLEVSENQYQDYPHVDVTALIKDIHENPESFHGIMIRLINEQTYRTMVFGSSDHPSIVKRPILTIYYSQPTGSEVTASFTYMQTDTLTVAFQDQSSGATSWIWDFGDGQFSNEQNPVHTFPVNQDYRVCLSAGNCSYSDVACDTVSFCQLPQSNFRHELINDSVVAFYNESVDETSWMWNFGDGTYSEEINPVHYFQENGTYHVCLTATSVCGNNSHCDTVNICMQTIPSFEYEIINDSVVRFIDQSLHANGWIWHFGDETTSIQQNPVHVYSHSGIYHVCLTTVNECGNLTTCDTVEICFEVVAEYEFEMINDSTVQFTDQSVYPESWIWQFDDETYSILQNPLHMFEQSGTYHVCLTAQNICSSASVCYDIDILMPQQRIIVEPLIVYPENDQSGFMLLLPGSLNTRYVSVFNLMGKRVYYSSISPGATEFQLPDLEEGIYIIELMLDGSMNRFKIYSQ